MRHVIATWSSKGGKWTAELIKAPLGYEIREQKDGELCGSAFRRSSTFASDSEAIAWAKQHVAGAFDVRVPMRQTQ